LVRELWDRRMALTVIGTIVVLGGLLFQISQRRLWLLPAKYETKAVLSVSLTTIASYGLFLFFWLPYNTFYRLFYLPAIALIIGILLRGIQRTGQLRLAFSVAAIFLFNFCFDIYPQTRPAANPPSVSRLKCKRSGRRIRSCIGMSTPRTIKRSDISTPK